MAIDQAISDIRQLKGTLNNPVNNPIHTPPALHSFSETRNVSFNTGGETDRRNAIISMSHEKYMEAIDAM